MPNQTDYDTSTIHQSAKKVLIDKFTTLSGQIFARRNFREDKFSRGEIFANGVRFAKISPREMQENRPFAKIYPRENLFLA